MTHTAASLKAQYSLLSFQKVKTLLNLKATGWQSLADKLNEREKLEAAEATKKADEQAQQENELALEVQITNVAVEKIQEIGETVQLTVESWKKLQNAVSLGSGWVNIPLETTGVIATSIVHMVSFDYYCADLILSAIADEIEKQEFRDAQNSLETV
jgi:hypothetical protein